MRRVVAYELLSLDGVAEEPRVAQQQHAAAGEIDAMCRRTARGISAQR